MFANVAAPLTVKVFKVVFQVTHKLSLTEAAVNVALPVEVIFTTVTSPVKFEVPVTANCHNVAPSEVNVVISPEVADNQVIVASVEVSVSMLPVVAVKPAVVVSQVTDKFQATDKSEPALTFQVNVDVPVTVKFPPAETLPEVSNVAVLTSVAITLSMLPVVALTVVAEIVVPVNVPSAVMFPVNSTLPLIVCNVTLDKSKFIDSIRVSNADSSKEIL